MESRESIRRVRCVIAFVLSAVCLLAFVPMAGADLVVCSPSDVCADARSAAVDRTGGLLYVADNANGGEVEIFDADDGTHLDSFPVGGSVSDIAVDNDSGSEPPRGDVYVFDSTNNRVRRYHPDGEHVLDIGEGLFASRPGLDLGPEGIVYVADNAGGVGRVQKFDHEGNPVGSCSPLPSLIHFVVDSAGSFYLSFTDVRKFNASCAQLNVRHSPSVNIRALAVDASDNLFVGDSSGFGLETATYRYTPAGELTRVFYGNGTLKRRPIALVPYTGPNGDVFAVESPFFADSLKRVLHISVPPPGPVVHPNPDLSEANPVGNTQATLNARINPEGKATEFRFEYLTKEKYIEDGESFAAAQSSPLEPLPEEQVPAFVPPPFGLAAASAEIGCSEPEVPSQPACLEPETEYVFRAVASNEDSELEERFGPVAEFTTAPPFEILATFSTRVGTDSARVGAEVNPLNIPATGHFEYVTQAQFEASGFAEATVTADVDFGSGEEPVVRGAQLSPLKPNTTYRYRVFVENPFHEEFGETETFRTFASPGPPEPCPNDQTRTGPSAALPDCRAYEMVSPPDKEGGEVAVLKTVPGNPAELTQSAARVPAQGRGLAYSSHRAFGDAISSPYTSQYIASRDPDEGWSSHGISPPREGASFTPVWLDSQYKAFSEDLRWAWLRSDSEPPLEEDAVPGYPNLYRRDNASDDYTALCPTKPPAAAPNEYLPRPQGFSADGQTALFRANDRLTAQGSAGANQLFACRAGQLRLVSVLPSGGAAADHSSAGTDNFTGNEDERDDSVHNALSTDGERVYWTNTPSKTGPGKIYLRARPFAAGAECASESTPCTVPVSEAVETAGSDSPARFWTAAADGSRAIFSFASGPLAGDLYEYDAEAEGASLIAGGVSGVAGFSEDASRTYLVSTEAKDEGALGGQANLYLHEEGEFTLVATLPGGTVLGSYCRIDFAVPFERCTRATPDGSRLAFMSADPLTGYDNTDAQSGQDDAEVFLFDATAKGGEGELLCVSCNPSGQRPAGKGAIAAQIPSWENAFYASRALSADGRRLFFESFDPLVPTDTNGALDVYQWQRAGKGGCDASDHDHFSSNGGCVSLISTGRDRRDSEFADASADGADVFFKTTQSISNSDPGLIDLYDARVGGGFEQEEAEEAPCEGDACSPAPPPPAFAPPGTATLDGPEGVPQANRCTTVARKAKGLSRRAKRLRAKARRSNAARRSARMRRKAKRFSKRARKLSRTAKRCRRRAVG